MKNIFHSFSRATVWWKMKISEKIADTSFSKQQTQALTNKFAVVCCCWSYWLIWVLEWKCFLRNITIMYTVKVLQRSYDSSLTLSRLFLLKPYIQRIYWILSSLQEMAIITVTIICICMKKNKLAKTSTFK